MLQIEVFNHVHYQICRVFSPLFNDYHLLQTLKDTGMRCGEALSLKWVDLDLEQKILTLNNPENNGKPRQFRLSDKLRDMLKQLKKKDSEKLWTGNLQSFRVWFQHQRKRTAQKLQNQRINRIHFHTLRHFYATRLYHKTKDLLLIKERLGHRSINSTLIYTQLISLEAENYDSAVAKSVEAQQLVEQGFEFVCDIEDVKLFRKKKLHY